MVPGGAFDKSAPPRPSAWEPWRPTAGKARGAGRSTRWSRTTDRKSGHLQPDRRRGHTVYGTGYAYGGELRGRLRREPRRRQCPLVADRPRLHLRRRSLVAGRRVRGRARPHLPETSEHSRRPAPHRASGTVQLLALTKTARGFGRPEQPAGSNTAASPGQPAPALVSWFPQLTPGRGDGGRDAGGLERGLGRRPTSPPRGEFTAVNGKPQQGLVRFAVPVGRAGPDAGSAAHRRQHRAEGCGSTAARWSSRPSPTPTATSGR